MKRIIGGCVLLILISGSLFVSRTSAGQEVARNETVMNRARPELDALGVRLGAFQLFPEVAVGAGHSDNIYADDVDIISDWIYAVSPVLELRSNWNNHAFSLGADADIFRYKEFDSEDREDYSIWSEVQLDTGRSNFFLGEVSHRRLHEDRASPDDVRGLEPTAYDLDRAAISFEAPHGAQRFHTIVTGEVQRRDFKDTPGAAGNINNDDRDREEISGTARFGYGFHPAYSIFLQGSAHSTDYELQFDDRGFERSSTGYEVAIGTTLDFSGETFGDLFFGYLSETYDDPRFDTIDGPSFGAEIFWNVSGLTTLGISGRREVEPTTTADTAGRDVVRVGVSIDHELLRNMILGLSWDTANEDFWGIDREDRVQSARFSARYMMNRRMGLEFTYRYLRRDTEPLTAGGIEFSRNVFGLSVKGQL